MKKTFSFLFFALLSFWGLSQHYEIKKETISLEVYPGVSDTRKGIASVNVKSLINGLDTVKLHLLHLSVDSIKHDGVTVPFAYNDTLISIALQPPVALGDTFELVVYYHGKPVIDPSGWGGFYFSGDIAFNLGVGFQDVPHSYGRVWFPCVDSFAYKSLYEFYITTDTQNVAVCNGVQEGVSVSGGKKTWHWVLHQPIPSYLASVAVGPYIAYSDTYNGINGTVPILIYTTQSYASKVSSSFSNLKDILAGFEQYFGPYMWDRVGYVAVPFNSGAMEHATNIAYPQVCIDGTHTYESLYAHELSHHWFGDLITTASEEEMWINEGWASFAEAFYNEFLYGHSEYLSYISNEHAKALKDGAYDDGGWFALDSVPKNVTYGTTSYNKGASVVHTLRYYMGDSLFFSSVKQMLQEHAWETVSSQQMKTYLSQYSGIDLSDFFKAWVETPGHLHFSVDSFEVEEAQGNYLVNLHVKQKLYHKDIYGTNNIVEFTFVDSSLHFETYRLKFSGETFDTVLQVAFYPSAVITDLYEKTMDASVSEYKIFNTTGTYSFSNEFFTLTVAGTVSDTSFINVRHNMVSPDGFKSQPQGLFLDTLRYWEITNIFPQDLYYQAKFYYGSTGSYSHLDDGFVDCPVDSLVLLYRRDNSDDWRVALSHASGSQYGGYIILDEPLKTGQYSLGKKNGFNAVENEYFEEGVKIFPVPSDGVVTVRLNKKYDKLTVVDSTGKVVKNENKS